MNGARSVLTFLRPAREEVTRRGDYRISSPEVGLRGANSKCVGHHWSELSPPAPICLSSVHQSVHSSMHPPARTSLRWTSLQMSVRRELMVQEPQVSRATLPRRDDEKRCVLN